MTAHIDTPAGTTDGIELAGSLELMDAQLIRANPQNPRKYFDEAALQELADSMKPVGHNTIPVLVRPLPGGSYELVYGERRWRACVLAGYRVLTMVREMTDQESLEAAVVENLQRQDISAMEEAQGFQALIERGGYTADTLAEKLGKSRSHVFARLRLLKLHPKVQEALAAGDVEASVADLIAKFPTVIQAEALKELTGNWVAREHGLSFRHSKAELEKFWPKLKTAPWKPKQETKLPGGPCAQCPKNSDNMPDLATSPGVCTDRHCFTDKVSALREILAAELEAKGAKIVPAEDAAKLFKYGDEPGYDSGYKLATEPVWDVNIGDDDEKDPPSWQALLKDTDVPVLSAVTPSGKVVKVVDVKAARAALVAKGVIKAVRGGQEASPEEKRKLREKNRLERYVNEQVAKKCIESLTTDATADERFCFAAALLLAGSYRGVKVLKEKHQIEGDDLPELYRSLQRLTTHDVVEVLMVNACMQGPGDWAGWELTERRIPGALGVDLKTVTKQAKKDYTTEAASKPAKKAKAKKPKPQPKED